MKWTALLILTIGLFVFWPKDEARSPISSTKQKSASVQRPSTERRRSGGHSTSSGLQNATTKDLEERVLSQWPEIESGLPARDPRVVKFIRTLRELGKRDGPGTLDFLDQIDQTDKEAAWIQARMAVAGGWALSDPEAAARSLLEKDHILQENYQELTMDFNLGSKTPAHQSITRAARQIFELWAEENHEDVKKTAVEIVSRGSMWNFGIQTQLCVIANRDGVLSGTASINRNSIDYILNNPNRTVPQFHASQSRPLTSEMQTLGEPDFNQEGWAARNPELALGMIHERRFEKEPDLISLISGLARAHEDYGSLLAMADPTERMKVASHLVQMKHPTVSERIWQLDGRETTWRLPPEIRSQAAETLIKVGRFTPSQRETLMMKFNSFPVTPPELPNQQKDPAE
jgi:hypothetical protein